MDDATTPGPLRPAEGGDAGWWLRDIAFDADPTWQQPWLLVCALYAAPAVPGGATVGFARKWEDCDDVVVAETARWALSQVAIGSADAQGGRMSEHRHASDGHHARTPRNREATG